MLSEFKNRLKYLNDVIFFDDKMFLREKTSDPNRLQEYIDEASNLLTQPLNNEDEYFVSATIGNLYRILGEPEKAITYLTFCLNYAKASQQISREIVSLIRLGEAYKYNNNHDEALNQFNVAMERCKSTKIEDYIDFVQQHRGKCLMELSRLDEAEECFLEAIKIRKQKGDNDLISSTQKAIDYVRAL